MKREARKDLLFGGTAGAVVCATLALTVTTMGPMLGVQWPGNGSSAGLEKIAMPEARPAAERPAPSRGPEPRPTARPSADREASQPRRRTRSTSEAATRRRARTPRRVDVPAATLPPARTKRPSASATPPAPPAAAAASPAQPAAPAPAAKGRNVKLRVASVSVTTDADDKPEVRVGVAISNAKPNVTVPPQVTLHLRPELPAAPEPSGTALALRAHIDVVDAVAAAVATTPGMQMRVRMAFAPTTSSVPTVADRGDENVDGQSNVLGVTVPLSALAPAPVDPPPAGAPGEEPTEPPAETPPAAEPPLEKEILLDLTAPESADEEPVGETTDVPVPADPAGEEQPADSMPVTVEVDNTATAAAPTAETVAAPPAEEPTAPPQPYAAPTPATGPEPAGEAPPDPAGDPADAE